MLINKQVNIYIFHSSIIITSTNKKSKKKDNFIYNLHKHLFAHCLNGIMFNTPVQTQLKQLQTLK